MKKSLLVFIIIVSLAIALTAVYYGTQVTTVISSFEECAQRFPVMESYPPRCQVPGGPSFTQNIGNELELSDIILLESPRPNQQIKSPLAIRGRARGPWFFEASFSAQLQDASGNLLAQAVITADGEWMTEDFVPFQGQLIFATPATADGVLLLEKANPSGLPEHAQELRIPVVFTK